MTFRLSGMGYDLLEHFEQGPEGGFAPRPYQGKADAPNKFTIGWGHLIKKGESFPLPLTSQQADDLLGADVEGFEEKVSLRLLPVKSEVRQCHLDAMLSLAFNVGYGVNDGKPGDFADSTLVNLYLKKMFQLAAAEFDKWIFSAGVIRPGLIRRRKCEKYLFLNNKNHPTFFL